jgi:hypothetical protein
MKSWDEMLAEKVIRYLMEKYMPTYHISRNPVREKKSKLVWKESTLEDARDMAIEIAKARMEHDGI